MSDKKHTAKEVFRYPCPVSQQTIKRYYADYRKARGEPICCDATGCSLKSEPVIWNRKELTLHLDHINGVNSDASLSNLRLLCPNCHSQQRTTGGGNIGRVTTSDDGFSVRVQDGKTNYAVTVMLNDSVRVGDSVEGRVVSIEEEES